MRLTAEQELTLEIAEFRHDPLGFVMFAFPWDTDPSIQQVELQEPWASRYNCIWGPDKWACEFLDDLGKATKKNGFDPVESKKGENKTVSPVRFATASGHGIGKSALTAWLVLWIICTRPFCKGIVTAGTMPQLQTKTWAELGKWLRNCICQHWFNYSSGKGSLALYHKNYKEYWRVDGYTCKEENSDSFQGLHAADSTPFYIFDEASAIPDKIYEVRDFGLTDGEPMVFDFGNPTRNSGRFYEECVGTLRHRYNVRSIDSRDVSITSKTLFKQEIEDYGEDSDRVKVRIRGIFPSASSHQFISGDDVDQAMRRELVENHLAPLVLGVDVARFGSNESVIYPRLGDDARSFPPRRFSGLNTIQLAGRVAECVHEFEKLNKRTVSICVDATGVGGGVVDQLTQMGYKVTSVISSSRPTNSLAYRMRMDEIWDKMRISIRDRLCLPDRTSSGSQEIRAQLTQREYDHTIKGQIALESKSDMEGRGLVSPDIADALALTFAVDLAPIELHSDSASPRFCIHEYDPLRSNW